MEKLLEAFEGQKTYYVSILGGGATIISILSQIPWQGIVTVAGSTTILLLMAIRSAWKTERAQMTHDLVNFIHEEISIILATQQGKEAKVEIDTFAKDHPEIAQKVEEYKNYLLSQIPK